MNGRPCSQLGMLLLLSLPAAAIGSSAARAAPPPADDAVEAGRRALSRGDKFPWYDPETDGLRRIEVQPPDMSDERDSSWRVTFRSRPTQRRARSGPGALFWSVMKVLFWTLLAALLALLLVVLIRTFLRHEEGPSAAAAAADDDEEGVDRVERLPFRVRRPRGDLLAEARARYQEGDFDQAVIYLFSYQLVQLDKHQVIYLNKGKTNRQYLREVGPRQVLSAILERTMVAFEDVFFGRHPLGRDRFESCWRSMNEFHQQLEQAGA